MSLARVFDRTKTALLIALACCAIALPAVGQVEASAAAVSAEPVLQPLPVSLAEAAASARVRHGIPGLSVAVRLSDGAVHAGAFGLADVENGVPARVETQFRLASISKSFTAVIAWRLAQRDRLDLDRPVREIVPLWPKKRWPVTTRQLLGHLGGVRHYRFGSDEIRSNRHYDGVVAALAIFAEDPLLHEPGTGYRYTTFGYNLAGAVCVTAAGRRASFRSLLRDEILTPAGMTALRLDDQDAIIPFRAQGYRLAADGTLRNSAPVDTSNKVPGGGLTSTAADLARFSSALLDGRLLDESGRRTLWTVQRTRSGEATGYGLGFSVRGGPDAERWVVGHSGAQPRVSTLWLLDVRTGFAVVLFANLEGRAKALRALSTQLFALLGESD